jgi:hypothetical protein
MATRMVLKNVETWLNGSTSAFTNGRVTSLSIPYEANMLDATAFTTSTGIMGNEYEAGLVGWTVDIEAIQDYDASMVDATLFPLVGASDFIFRVAVSSTGVDAEHPQYSGRVLLQTYNPLNGNPGVLAKAPITLQGLGLLVRNTVSSSGG